MKRRVRPHGPARRQAKAATRAAMQARARIRRQLRDRNGPVTGDDTPEESFAGLWSAIGALRDGFAIFGPDRRLKLVNHAYAAAFGAMRHRVVPGASHDSLIALAIEAGITGLTGPLDPEALRHRFDSRNPETLDLRLPDGRFAKLVTRHTAQGDTVCLVVDTTALMRMWAAVEAIPDGFVL